MGRIFLVFLGAVSLLLAVGYTFNLFQPDPTTAIAAAAPAVTPPDQLGDWLYAPAKEEAKQGVHRLPGGVEPIVIQAHLAEIDKIDVPSKIGGKIMYIGDGVPEGVTQVAGVAPFMQPEYKQTSIKHKGRDVVKFYRPLERGMEVLEGTMVGEIDYAQALYAYLQHKALLEQAGYELIAAKELDKEADNRLQVEIRLGKIASERELSDARLTRVRTKQELAKAETAITKEETELDNALHMLSEHEIRPKRAMKKSYVKAIYRDTGEAVKELEPILQLYSIDRLMAEAFVEIQDAMMIRPNQLATIEPTVETRRLRRFDGHRKPITGVAFVQNGADLYVVSSSEDGYIKIWQRDVVGTLEDLYHREPVRTLACSPAGAKRTLCAAGMSDGTIHVWDLFADKQLKPTRAVDPIAAHNDAITALAFSADGQFLATGAADGSIKLWSMEDGKLKYAFDAAHGVDTPHQGAVTSLHFTPQSRLVSAARDSTLRVWNLKEKGAHIEGTVHAGRSGVVHELGVSDDGRYMLFDQGKSLQLLNVANGRNVNSLRAPGGATPFETLATFSPDASLILTAGAPEGRLQLWRTPGEAQRGFEVRQYVTDDRSAATCATFAPTAAPGTSQFAASGSKDGYVYLWPVPTKQEVDTHRITNVPVKLLSKTIEAGSRQVRLGVEVANPSGSLYPGRPVTIVFE